MTQWWIWATKWGGKELPFWNRFNVFGRQAHKHSLLEVVWTGLHETKAGEALLGVSSPELNFSCCTEQSPSKLRWHWRSCYRRGIGRCSWILACWYLCCALHGLEGGLQTSHRKLCFASRWGWCLHFLSLALSWIDLLPHVRGLYLPDECMCLRAGCRSEIAPFSPPPQIDTFKRAVWRLHPDLWAYSAWGGGSQVSSSIFAGRFSWEQCAERSGMLLCPLSMKILELFQFDLDISTTWKGRDSKPQPWKLNTSGL